MIVRNSGEIRLVPEHMPKPFSEAERQEFLAGKHIAVLSVAASDGRPPASVPIWYDYVPGGDIRVNTGATGRKARLIESAGAVTLVVQREELPYQYVIVEGTVVDATTPAPQDAREAIAIRYLGDEGGREFANQMDGSGSVLFTIRPDRWFTADFSADL
jgi:PPOX class probable F420-dependent enzyme